MKKDRILSDEKGYLICLLNNYYFFPSKDSMVNDFPIIRDKIGFKLGEFKYSDVFKKIGYSFPISVDFSGSGKNLTVDSIIVLPVEVRSMPIRDSKLKWEKEELFFNFNSNKINIYYEFFNKEILSVYPINYSDVKKFKDFPLD